MRACNSILALLPPLLVSVPSVASADTIWSWSFDQTEFVAGPSDSIVLHATLFNSSLSTEPLTETDGASFTGDLQKIYDFTFGPTGDSSEYGLQFSGLNVGPGESFPFVVGILTPIGGSAPIGTHPFCCEAHLGFGSVSSSAFLPPLNTFEIHVVPEPPMIALFGVSLLALVWLRRPRVDSRA
jgi:PEP-CTERM motif